MFEIVVMALTLFANAAAAPAPPPLPARPDPELQGPALNGLVERPGHGASFIRGFIIESATLPDGTRLRR